MKIGIITMHRIINYGSFLQAYALKSILESYGHSCKFLDIEPGDKISNNSSRLVKFRRKIKYLMDVGITNYIYSRNFNIIRSHIINSCLHDYLDVSKYDYDTSDCDLVIVGSDEVFNVLQDSPWGFSHQLLGDIDCKKRITYAASFGHTTLQKIDECGVRSEMKRLLSNYDSISVRDSNSECIINEILNVQPSVNLDPVLIYSYDKEITKSYSIDGRYLLVYGYNNRIREKTTIKNIKNFAAQNNLITISVGNYQPWCDRQIACTPFETLFLFMNADYIVSDTFHGTVLSIKYGKHFASIVRESNKQKIEDLLSKFDLVDHICTNSSNFSLILQKEINVDHINNVIHEERNSTRKYFSENGIC